MDPATQSVLLECLGHSPQKHIPRDADWPLIARLATRHGVAPLLYRRLKALDPVPAPDDVMQRLQESYSHVKKRNTSLYTELDRVLALLNEQHINTIALKGAYLARSVYGDIGLRSMGDVDLLVREEDLDGVEQILLGLGARPYELNRVIALKNYQFTYFLPPSGLALEIHWDLTGRPRIPVDLDGLWSRSRPVTLMNSPTRTLALEDMLCYLCIHAVKHLQIPRLRMLCDVAQVLTVFRDELDWQGVQRRAREWGVMRAVSAIVQLAEQMLHAPVAEEWGALRRDDPDTHSLELMRRQFLASQDVDQYVEEVSRLWGSRSARGKLKMIRYGFFPPRETMALHYPAPADSWLIFLFYPARCVYALRSGLSALRRIVFQTSRMRTVVARSNQVADLRDRLLSP